MKNIFLALLIVAAGCSSNRDRQMITVSTLLDEMISFDCLSLYPDPYFTCKQVSSYDRRSVSPNQPGWFANDDGFGCISVDTIGDIVRQLLFDEEGPGAITRIWITTNNKRGVFKFYFDHATEPDWVVEGYDLSNTGYTGKSNGLFGIRGSKTRFSVNL